MKIRPVPISSALSLITVIRCLFSFHFPLLMTKEKYVFEQWPGDNLSGPRVEKLFFLIKSSICFGDNLHYRPCSLFQESIAAKVLMTNRFMLVIHHQFSSKEIPILTSDELFRSVKYQALTLGTSYGEFHVFKGPASSVLISICVTNTYLYLFRGCFLAVRDVLSHFTDQ